MYVNEALFSIHDCYPFLLFYSERKFLITFKFRTRISRDIIWESIKSI